MSEDNYENGIASICYKLWEDFLCKLITMHENKTTKKKPKINQTSVERKDGKTASK